MRQQRSKELDFTPGLFQLAGGQVILAVLIGIILALPLLTTILATLISGIIWFGIIYYASQWPAVSLIFGKTLCKGDENSKKLYLTFDDGPHPVYTPGLLDILKKRGVKATFFLLGKNAAAYPDIVKRIYKEGHTIGSHTENHSRLAWSSNERIINEIDRGGEIIQEITGEIPLFFRPPFASRDHRVFRAARNRGLTLTMWSLDTYDWSNPGVEIILARINRHVQPGDILLFHDSSENPLETDRSQTLASVETLIEQYIKQGYEFSSLEEVSIKKGEYIHG